MGVSERGRLSCNSSKKMTQWSMRITAYADRLLQGLDTIDWSESIKESQRNWIGKSVGASIDFTVAEGSHKITVFTTRPDTLFGVTYLTLAPEHPLVLEITTEEQRAEVEAYIADTAKRSERDRMADTRLYQVPLQAPMRYIPLQGSKCLLDRGLCIGRLWYGSGDGCTCGGRARLRLCPVLQGSQGDA